MLGHEIEPLTHPDTLFSYHHIALIAIILFIVAIGRAKELWWIIKKVFEILGHREKVVVNVMEGQIAKEGEGEMPKQAQPATEKLCPYSGEKCSDHALVMGFITDSKGHQDRLYNKVNKANLKLARIETMMTVLLKARGLKVELSAMDFKDEEDET